MLFNKLYTLAYLSLQNKEMNCSYSLQFASVKRNAYDQTIGTTMQIKAMSSLFQKQKGTKTELWQNRVHGGERNKTGAEACGWAWLEEGKVMAGHTSDSTTNWRRMMRRTRLYAAVIELSWWQTGVLLMMMMVEQVSGEQETEGSHAQPETENHMTGELGKGAKRNNKNKTGQLTDA